MKEENTKGRRDFIRNVTLGAGAMLSIPQIVSAAYVPQKSSKITLAKDDVILFQGDSITDAGRNKEEKAFNNAKALGTGYALMATSKLLLDHPDKNLQLYNRGISGNKVFQLAERWDADCLQLKPTILSILIGVNDFWHTLDGKYAGTIEIYRNDLKALLDKTKQQLPNVQLIIGEPFALAGIKAVDEKWFPMFYDYQKAALEIANIYSATFIPYQRIFDRAAKSAPGVYWTYDGVHPSVAGSQLMAHAWRQAIKVD
jgi:lysophospholipase L1-like esterase